MVRSRSSTSLAILVLSAARWSCCSGFSSALTTTPTTRSPRVSVGWVSASAPPTSLRATEKESAQDESNNNENKNKKNKITFDLFSEPNADSAADNSPLLDEQRENSKRKTRLDWEQKAQSQFATGDELRNLRQDIESLHHNLQWAEAMKDENRIADLTKAIKNGQNRDPEFIYNKAFKLISQAKIMKDASKEEKDALIEKWSKLAKAARECLPQFHLEGLFVGK